MIFALRVFLVQHEYHNMMLSLLKF